MTSTFSLELVSSSTENNAETFCKDEKPEKNYQFTVFSVVCEAFKSLGSGSEKGISIFAIKKWIKCNHNEIESTNLNSEIKLALMCGLQSGIINRDKNSKTSRGVKGYFVLDLSNIQESESSEVIAKNIIAKSTINKAKSKRPKIKRSRSKVIKCNENSSNTDGKIEKIKTHLKPLKFKKKTNSCIGLKKVFSKDSISPLCSRVNLLCIEDSMRNSLMQSEAKHKDSPNILNAEEISLNVNNSSSFNKSFSSNDGISEKMGNKNLLPMENVQNNFKSRKHSSSSKTKNPKKKSKKRIIKVKIGKNKKNKRITTLKSNANVSNMFEYYERKNSEDNISNETFKKKDGKQINSEILENCNIKKITIPKQKQIKEKKLKPKGSKLYPKPKTGSKEGSKLGVKSTELENWNVFPISPLFFEDSLHSELKVKQEDSILKSEECVEEIKSSESTTEKYKAPYIIKLKAAEEEEEETSTPIKTGKGNLEKLYDGDTNKSKLKMNDKDPGTFKIEDKNLSTKSTQIHDDVSEKSKKSATKIKRKAISTMSKMPRKLIKSSLVQNISVHLNKKFKVEKSDLKNDQNTNCVEQDLIKLDNTKLFEKVSNVTKKSQDTKESKTHDEKTNESNYIAMMGII